MPRHHLSDADTEKAMNEYERIIKRIVDEQVDQLIEIIHLEFEKNAGEV